MNRFRKISVLTFLTAVLISLLLSACGDAGGTGAVATPADADTNGAVAVTDNDNDGEGNDGAWPVVNHFLNQPWMTYWHWGEDEVSRAIMAAVEVDVRLARANTGDNQQLTLFIASGDLPDVVTVDLWSPAHYMLQRSGLVAEVRSIIDRVDPYFNDYIGEVYFELLADEDGINWFLAACVFTDIIFANNLYAPVGPWNPALLVREDLFEELGRPDVTTPEGLMSTLLEVRDRFPDIVPFNFNRDMSTVAGGLINTPFGEGWIINGFGVQHFYRTADDRVIGAWNDPRYLDAIKFISRMYRYGIITAETLVQEFEQARSQIESGNTFMWIGGVADIGRVPSGNPDVRYVAAPPLNQMRGMQQVGLGWTSTFFYAGAENIDAAMRYMTFMYSKEGNIIAQWGREGIEWYWGDDGLPYFTDEKVERRARDFQAFQQETGFRLYYWGINYWDHFIEKAMMTRDPFLASAIELYGPYFGARVDFLSLTVDPDTEEGLIAQRLVDLLNVSMVNIYMSYSDAEVEEKFNEMIATFHEMGIERVEAIWTQRSNRKRDIFNRAGVSYMYGWPRWGGNPDS